MELPKQRAAFFAGQGKFLQESLVYYNISTSFAVHFEMKNENRDALEEQTP